MLIAIILQLTIMISIPIVLNNMSDVDIYQQRYMKLSCNAKDKINTVILVTKPKNNYIAYDINSGN